MDLYWWLYGCSLIVGDVVVPWCVKNLTVGGMREVVGEVDRVGNLGVWCSHAVYRSQGNGYNPWCFIPYVLRAYAP